MSDKATSLKIDVCKWTVLIIDDEPDNLAVASLTLNFNGARVYTALDGRSGLALIKTLCPTVILLDISMPVMDGWEVIRRIRASKSMASLPVIAVTAHVEPRAKRKVFEAGFDGYVAKPFDVKTLVDEIQTQLANARRTP